NDLLIDCHHFVGKGNTRDDRDVLAIEKLVSDLVRYFRFELAVFPGHLNRHSAELSPIAFDREHEGVIHILPERRTGPRECPDEANLHRLLGREAVAEDESQGERQQCEQASHIHPSGLQCAWSRPHWKSIRTWNIVHKSPSAWRPPKMAIIVGTIGMPH